MTSRYMGVMGRFASISFFSDVRRRRMWLGGVAVLLALLSIFPQPQKAVASLSPMDQNQSGLASALAPLGGFAGYLGTQQIMDVYLKVGRSVEVRRKVIKSLKLSDRWGSNSEAYLLRRLESEIEIRALRGSILQIEAKFYDGDFAIALVTAYASAMRERLAEISQSQTAFKRAVLDGLMSDASKRLKAAEEKLNKFRRENDIPDPPGALGGAGSRLPGLQALLQSKESDLVLMLTYLAPGNYSVQALRAEIAEIRRQIELARKPDFSNPTSLERVIVRSTEYQYLIRDVSFTQNLYESYMKLLEGTYLEDLVSVMNLRYLEDPHLDPDWQVNFYLFLPSVLLLLLIAALEFRVIIPRSE